MAIAEGDPVLAHEEPDDPVSVHETAVGTDLDGDSDLDLDAGAAAAVEEVPISGPGRLLLATLAVSAGVIHLVMVPSHAAEWLAEGIAFAATGWFQIGLALVLWTRPSRFVVRVSCFTSMVFIAVWTVTRTFGWPFGPESGIPHTASFVDITCVLLEAALIVIGYELLVRPDRGESFTHESRVVLSAIPLAVILLTTAAIASPSAFDHAHGSEDAAGHDHGNTAAAGAPASASADAHNHDGAATASVDDKGFSLIMNGKGEGGGHAHNDSVVPVDAATQQKLDAQLAQTKVFMEKYPTVTDAEAAGYRREGPFLPGLGAHYLAPGVPSVGTKSSMDDAALAHPFLIYDGVAPESRLAGFMYITLTPDQQTPPEGFAGPNDHWHFHENVCVVSRPDQGVDVPLGADTSATKELCDKYGGHLIQNTGYMAHVWTVPGYESPQGVFSNLNAKITCPNGTYYVIPPEEYGTRTNACRDVSV